MASCDSWTRANLSWNPYGLGCNKNAKARLCLVNRVLHEDALCNEFNVIGFISTDEAVHPFGRHKQPSSQGPSEVASTAKGSTYD